MDYWISYNNVNEMIILHPHFKDDIMYILENSNYIGKDDMIQRTRDLVSKWISDRDSNRNVYILMDEEKKLGSRKWLYIECYDLLPSHIVINPGQKINDNNPEIIIIDDWSITGIDLLRTINEFYCNNEHIKSSSITYIITYCSKEYFNFDSTLTKMIFENFSCPHLVAILYRCIEKLGGLTIDPRTQIPEFIDYLPEFLDNVRNYPDIYDELVTYTNSPIHNLYCYQQLQPLNITPLNPNFNSEFMDPITDDCFYIVHSEYKIPDSTLFRKLLHKCRDPINRDFLIEIGENYNLLHNNIISTRT